MFETFDHTADLGLRIVAPDLPGLFSEAARALTSILVENADAIRPAVERRIAIDGTEPDYLLFDWLTELLYLAETERFVGSRFEVALTAEGVAARVLGETLDPHRHRPSHEVKAITYHGLSVEQSPDGWTAEMIVDI